MVSLGRDPTANQHKHPLRLLLAGQDSAWEPGLPPPTPCTPLPGFVTSCRCVTQGPPHFHPTPLHLKEPAKAPRFMTPLSPQTPDSRGAEAAA